MEIVGTFIASQLQRFVLPTGTDPRSVWVLYMSYYILLTVGAVVFYLGFASLSYLFFFRWRRDRFFPGTLQPDASLRPQIQTEIGIALRSLPLMAVLMAPFPVGVALGYSKMYYRVDQYGWGYLVLSVPMFLLVTDAMIYFIHRGLHLPLLYKYIHKPHHTYRFTTPFSSHAFHPVDGWAQGVPYYIFCYLLPFHHVLFVCMFMFVNFWTISIHDQVDFCGAGLLNSTGHHTVHHADFVYNYGQYFTLWDRLCGSYKAADRTNSLLTGERVPHCNLNPQLRSPEAKSDVPVDAGGEECAEKAMKLADVSAQRNLRSSKARVD